MITSERVRNEKSSADELSLCATAVARPTANRWLQMILASHIQTALFWLAASDAVPAATMSSYPSTSVLSSGIEQQHCLCTPSGRDISDSTEWMSASQRYVLGWHLWRYVSFHYFTLTSFGTANKTREVSLKMSTSRGSTRFTRWPVRNAPSLYQLQCYTGWTSLQELKP